MRKSVIVILGAVLAAGVGFYFGYPPYVTSRIAADIKQFNDTTQGSSLSMEALEADPWTSTVTARDVAFKDPYFEGAAAQMTIKTESFLFLAPIQTITAITAEDFTARDIAGGIETTAKSLEMRDLDFSRMNFAPNAEEPQSPMQALNALEFTSMTMVDGTLRDGKTLDATYERISVTELRDGIFGEMMVEEMNAAEGKPANNFRRLALRGVEIADLEVLGSANPGQGEFWVPVAGGDPRGQALEIGEFEIEGAVIEPNDGKSDLVTLERLLVKSLSYAPPSEGGDKAAALKALTLESGEATGFVVNATDGTVINIGRTKVTGIADGMLGRVEVGAFSVSADKGEGAVGSVALDALNMAGIAEVMQMREEKPRVRISAVKVFRAFGIGGFRVDDLTFRHMDGTLYQAAEIALHDLDYFEGLPISATLTVTDNYQEIPKELIDSQLTAMSLPVALDIPTTSRTTGEVKYLMDMDTGALSLTNRSEDSINGLRTALEVRLSGLTPIFQAAAKEDPEVGRHVPGILLEELSIDVATAEEWPVPGMQDGKPSLRLFLAEILQQNAAAAPPEYAIVVDPVLAFLERGGSFRFALAPPQPLPVVQMQILPMLPPAQAIQTIGLTAIHE